MTTRLTKKPLCIGPQLWGPKKMVLGYKIPNKIWKYIFKRPQINKILTLLTFLSNSFTCNTFRSIKFSLFISITLIAHIALLYSIAQFFEETAKPLEKKTRRLTQRILPKSSSGCSHNRGFAVSREGKHIHVTLQSNYIKRNMLWEFSLITYLYRMLLAPGHIFYNIQLYIW